MGNTTSEPHYTIREIHRKNLYDKQGNRRRQRLKSSPYHPYSIKPNYNSWYPFDLPFNNNFPYITGPNMNNLPFPSIYHQQQLPISMLINQGWNPPFWNHYSPNYPMYPFH